MIFLKIRYASLPEESYISYIEHFYSNRSKLVSNDVDKFSKYRELIAKMASRNGLNRTVLEVGGGAGFQTGALLEEGFRKVTSSDYSKERVEYAIKHMNCDRLEYAVADVSCLPFDDNSFDAVVAVALLHCLPRSIKLQSLREISRVARKTIVILEPKIMYKRSMKRWVFSNAAQILDESQYIRDFICHPYDHFISEEGFKLAARHEGLMGAVEIKTYHSLDE